MMLFKSAVAATTGLVIGGLSTFMAINALSEGKRGLNIFSSHVNPNFYVLDAVNAIVCAGIGYAMASCHERRPLPNARFSSLNRLIKAHHSSSEQEPLTPTSAAEIL